MEEEVKDAYTYMLELRERIEETCVMAQKAISQANAKNKKYYEKKARSQKLEIGVKVLLLWPSFNNTQNKKQVRSFLGAVNYSRKFIPHCAELMEPLSHLTRNQASKTWTPILDKSFREL